MRGILLGLALGLSTCSVLAQFRLASERPFLFPGTSNSLAEDCFSDKAGNWYVIGYTQVEAASSYRALVAKLRPDGEVLWSRFINDPRGGAADHVYAELAHDGGLFVVGHSADEPNFVSSFLVKLNPSGKVVRYHDDESLVISSLAAGQGGNFYITGVTWSDVELRPETLVLKKLSKQGRVLWMKKAPLSDDAFCYGQRLSLDASGNLYSAVTIRGRLVVAKRLPGGKLVWQSTYAGPYVSSNVPALDVLPTGIFARADAEASLFVRFDPDGRQLWATRPRNAFTYSSDVVSDGSNLLVGRSVVESIDTDGNVIGETDLIQDNNNTPWWEGRLRSLPDGRYILSTTQRPNGESTQGSRIVIRIYEKISSDSIGPTIVSLSPSRVVAPGTNTRLFVEASGSGALRYQWLKSGRLVDGATNDTLVLTNVGISSRFSGPEAIGPYTVSVQDDNGTTRSTEVVVDSFMPPVAQSVVINQEARFTSGASSTPSTSVRWSHDGHSTVIGTDETLVIQNTTSAHAGRYDVTVVSCYGDVYTAHTHLQVCDQVRMDWQLQIADFEPTQSALDRKGQLLVAGTAPWLSSTKKSIRAAIFSSSGRRIASVEGGSGFASALAIDPARRVYLVGNMNPGGGYNIVTYCTAYSADLKRTLWERSLVSSEYGGATSAILEADGSTFHVRSGKRYRTSRYQYGSVLLLSETNATVLLKVGGDEARADGSVRGMERGADGDVFILTHLTDYPRFIDTVWRFRPNGELIWSRSLTNKEIPSIHRGLVCDSTGNPVLLGAVSGFQSSTSSTPARFAITKFNRDDGSSAWSTEFCTGSDDSPTGIAAADRAGNIIVLGDTVTLKLSSTGSVMWVSRATGSFLRLDRDGNAYLAGNVYEPGTGYRFTLSMLDGATGQRLWKSIPPLPGKAGVGLQVAPGGEAYLISGDGYVLKYRGIASKRAPTAPRLPFHAQTHSPGGFSLNAGEYPLGTTYVWYLNGIPLEGATNAILSIPSMSKDSFGGYTVEVRNAFGSSLSSEAWVAPPVRFQQTHEHGERWSFLTDHRFKYEVQSSTNLSTWTTIALRRYTNSTMSFGPVDLERESEFFRVSTER